MPHLRLEDHYTLYGYQNEPSFSLPNTPPIPIEYLADQNHFEAILSMRIFDFGTLKEQAKALSLEAAALKQKMHYEQKEQKLQQAIALKRIKTASIRLQSAKSALKSATSAFKTITQKYENGLADNVTYLDALKAKTEAKAAFEKAKNDLEIAYALYYYYHGKDPEEFLQ